MKIMMSGKHLEMGDSLQTHIREQITNLVDRYVGNILEGAVTIAKEHHLFCTELSLHVSHDFFVRSHGEDTDPYRSFDLAAEKIESRIKRYRKRLRDLKRNEHLGEMLAQHYVLNGQAEEDNAEDTPVIVAEMNKPLHTLTVGEAVMRMDLSESDFFVFLNASSGQVNVVYRRDDGHVGWIDPSKGTTGT